MAELSGSVVDTSPEHLVVLMFKNLVWCLQLMSIYDYKTV